MQIVKLLVYQLLAYYHEALTHIIIEILRVIYCCIFCYYMAYFLKLFDIKLLFMINSDTV